VAGPRRAFQACFQPLGRGGAGEVFRYRQRLDQADIARERRSPVDLRAQPIVRFGDSRDIRRHVGRASFEQVDQFGPAPRQFGLR
jgi:DNA repair photolyase